jgi:hypothetical protein
MDSNMHVAGQLTALGWTMLALYLVVALLAFRTAAVSGSANSTAMGRVWVCLGIILTALGLNKQLDLQTSLIELGRHIALREHLFAYRLELYFVFFLGFILTIIALFAAFILRFSTDVGKFARQFPLATSGCGLICAYIIIRAAFIDNLNRILGFDLSQIPFLWLLEAGGLLLIMVQALLAAPIG